MQFSQIKLLRIARFCRAKGHHAPNFVEKTFTYSHKTTKFTKVFSLESFPLYGTTYTHHAANHWHMNITTDLHAPWNQHMHAHMHTWKHTSMLHTHTPAHQQLLHGLLVAACGRETSWLPRLCPMTFLEHLPTTTTLRQDASLRTRSYIHTDMPTTLFSSHPTTDTMQTFQHVTLNSSVQANTNLQH